MREQREDTVASDAISHVQKIKWENFQILEAKTVDSDLTG